MVFQESGLSGINHSYCIPEPKSLSDEDHTDWTCFSRSPRGNDHTDYTLGLLLVSTWTKLLAGHLRCGLVTRNLSYFFTFNVLNIIYDLF